MISWYVLKGVIQSIIYLCLIFNGWILSHLTLYLVLPDVQCNIGKVMYTLVGAIYKMAFLLYCYNASGRGRFKFMLFQ